MRSGVIVTGVLGLGTALVFAAAAVAATVFPNGSTIVGGSYGWTPDGRILQRGGVVEAPVGIDDVVVLGGIAMPEQEPTLPGPGGLSGR
jgi:hypothetical protein